MTDAVAEIAAQWRSARPDLDPSPLLVLGRAARITALVDPLLRPPFAEAGLGSGDFDALAALRRTGAPHRLSPGALAEAMLVTSGAVSKRLDRLEARGLITRTAAADDARGRDVTLTPEGLRLTDELIATHLANERRLLTALTDAESTQLGDLLGKLLASLEPRP